MCGFRRSRFASSRRVDTNTAWKRTWFKHAVRLWQHCIPLQLSSAHWTRACCRAGKQVCLKAVACQAPLNVSRYAPRAVFAGSVETLVQISNQACCEDTDVPGSSGCPATRCEQSCPYQPAWHLQKPVLHSPCPLHWFTHIASWTCKEYNSWLRLSTVVASASLVGVVQQVAELQGPAILTL